MRDMFELCCKVVGLVAFCAGLYLTLNAIPYYIGGHVDAEKLFGQTLWQALDSSMRADMMASTRYVWLKLILATFLSGIAPMLFGLYLMRSPGFFVRLCYPDKPAEVSSGESRCPDLRTTEDSRSPESPEPTDKKYAPPGYYLQDDT